MMSTSRHLILLIPLLFATELVYSFSPAKANSLYQRSSFYHQSHRYSSSSVSTRTGGLCLTQQQDKNDESDLMQEKEELLISILSEINNQKDRLPCGLDCTDKERDRVANIILALQGASNNMVTQNNGKIDPKLLLGEWQLLYTSSRAMTINKSLSGLGRSTAAQFSSLTQKLTGSKFLGFVEYVERFEAESSEIVEGGGQSFDVTITGEWVAEDCYNSLSVEHPTTSVRMDLEKVMWAGSTNDAEMWDSLGPIKLLDIVYFANDLQILRGNVYPDSIFVFQKLK